MGGESPVVEFGILGPVQAVRDGRELALGGPRPRAVLALLLVAAGWVVPAERLVEELWGGAAPPGAAGTLRAHVSRLRTLLRPDAIVSTVLGAVRPGSIISLHLGHPGTVTALPAILRGLARRRLRAVTLTELLSP